MPAPTTAGAVSLFDHRPFFERALVFGVQHGILTPEPMARINQEAPKGIVQIARYFGTEFLRPELEAARVALVRLVSLYLEDSCGGDLRRAAESLRDHSLLSRSKAGSDMLKALIAMPQSTHFGLQSGRGFADGDKALLQRWIQRPLADYRAEKALRSANAHKMEAARWWAQEWELDEDDLQDADAEAVIRTALLLHATRRRKVPDWVQFEDLIARLRARHTLQPGAAPALKTLGVPPGLPAHLQPVVRDLCQSVQDDLGQLLDARRPIAKLLRGTAAFAGRYFWRIDSLTESDQAERVLDAAWARITGGHDDEASLLTLFLCLAVGSAPKTLLTPAGATRLLRQLRKTGWQPERVHRFIVDNAPHPHQRAYGALWESFVQESQSILLDDHDHTLRDAQALLRRECNVQT